MHRIIGFPGTCRRHYLATITVIDSIVTEDYKRPGFQITKRTYVPLPFPMLFLTHRLARWAIMIELAKTPGMDYCD